MGVRLYLMENLWEGKVFKKSYPAYNNFNNKYKNLENSHNQITDDFSSNKTESNSQNITKSISENLEHRVS